MRTTGNERKNVAESSNTEQTRTMNEIDEATLLKLAEAEILGEAKRATIRHSIAGPSGWKPVPKTNKSFLVNTLLQTLSSNRIISKKNGNLKLKKDSSRKLLKIDRKKGTSDNIVFKKPEICETGKGQRVNKYGNKTKKTKSSRNKKKGKVKK